MQVSFEGTGTVDPDFWASLQRLAQDRWPTELARLQRMSLVSGMDAVYDLSMFDLEWSPAYRHDSDQAVAWFNRRTGERREGSLSPYDEVGNGNT
jgi:hypothetical protein